MRKIHWDYESPPQCENGEIIILVQDGRAEIARFVTPKPKSAPAGGGNFIFEMGEDLGEKFEVELFRRVAAEFPELEDEMNPILISCPEDLRSKGGF